MKLFIEKRPTAVSVIGWFWIIVGFFTALASVASLLQDPPSESLIQEMAKDSPVMARALRHYFVGALLQFVVGQVFIFSGIGFLRLRAWARTALEVVSWLVVVFFAAIMVDVLVMMHTYLKDGALPCGVIGCVLGSAFYFGPVGLMLYFLRSRKVREAVGGNGGKNPA